MMHQAFLVPVQQWLLESVSDGKGMNPQLHNYWLAIHPPILYLGYVGFTIPFIYALGALMSGDVSEGLAQAHSHLGHDVLVPAYGWNCSGRAVGL